MGYPERLLSEGERIDLQLRPHWKALVFPVGTLVVTVGAAAFLAAVSPSGKTAQETSWIAIAVVAVAILVWFVLRPWMTWLNTNYVITNRRVVIQVGFIHREGRDIPLQKINDVSFKHMSLLDRILGCGDLLIESAGEHGEERLEDIPRVEETQREISTLISGDPAANLHQG
jgi:uncharacterized membrane protein YdbT with pleckstrin-like domain